MAFGLPAARIQGEKRMRDAMSIKSTISGRKNKPPKPYHGFFVFDRTLGKVKHDHRGIRMGVA
ncbi:MAG: hypothetical protein WDZ59_08165 [Pirellulales bacterium]